MRLKTLTALATAAALAGLAAEAAPWQVAPDAPGSAFLIDTASGALVHCAPSAPTGAKILDVFGATGEARPQAAHAGEFRCTAVRAAPEDPRAHRIAAILRARTGTLADLYDTPAAWPGADAPRILWPALPGNPGY
ncbi:MAG TPA: hypothetical protein VFN28_15885 [Amaricoccus sp.]|nr:hypothetical protein [Amaricoccus sp.]